MVPDGGEGETEIVCDLIECLISRSSEFLVGRLLFERYKHSNT